MVLTEVSERKALAERVAASTQFASAPKLRAFFLYVIDCSFRGQPDEATEQQIGIRIFGRPAGYNTGDDSVVRSQARLIRMKLAFYFESEGKQETGIIEMPKGHYLPVFIDRKSNSLGAANEAVSSRTFPGQHFVIPELESQDSHPGMDAQPPIDSSSSLRLPGIVRQILISLLLLALAFLGGAWAWHRWSTIDARRPDPLWSSFFSGTPQTLVIYSNPLFRGTPATGLKLVDPAAGPADSGVNDETYTGTGEVAAVRQLTRFFDAHNADFVLKRSRLVTWDQARSSNLVFVGAPSQNSALQDLPALSQFAIVVDSSGRGSIANRHPLPGEPVSFPPNDKSQETAIVALVPGIEAKTSILVISGLTTIGTQSAVEYLCRQENISALTEQAGTTSGALRPFEAVLQISISRGVGISSKLVLLHHH